MVKALDNTIGTGKFRPIAEENIIDNGKNIRCVYKTDYFSQWTDENE
jgi:hypothetical protein